MSDYDVWLTCGDGYGRTAECDCGAELTLERGEWWGDCVCDEEGDEDEIG